MANENNQEVQEEIVIQTQTIKTIPDKTLALIYLIAGLAVMIVVPIVFKIVLHSVGLIGWAIFLTGFFFVFLGLCGFVAVSQDAKKYAEKS